MSNFAAQFNAALKKAMSRSEAASLAGKASAAARRAKAGGGAPEQTTDAKKATDKANRLIAANPGKYGPKGAKGKGKAKAGAKPKGAKDPAAAKAKAEKETQATAEHEQRQKEHSEDRAQRQQDREQKTKEHTQAQAEHTQDRAQKQQEHAEDRAAKAKQQAAKAKETSSGGGKKSSSGDAKKQEKADKQKAQAELTSAASAFASGGQVTEQQMQRLVTEGLAKPRAFGGIELTPAGKSAAKRGTAQKMAKAQIDAILAENGLIAIDPAPLVKVLAGATSLHGWAAITKVDEEKRIVYGVASSELPDNERGIWKGEAYQGDIISSDAMRAAAPDYLQFPAIREMHQPSAAGTAVHFEVQGAETLIGAHIVDEQAWAKVVNKVYRGFSIGGRCKDAEIIKIEGRPFRKVTKLDLTEISLVDRPRNPDAKITLFKGVDMDPEQDATEVAENTDIAKAADPTKAIALLQQLRNDAETSGDMDAADDYTAAIRSVAQAAGIATTAADDEDTDLGDDSADLMMDDGSDGADDVAMAQSIGDLRKAHPELSDEGLIGLLLKQATATLPIAKRGMALSSANLAHAKTAHDALHKMTGGAVCAAPDDPQQRQMAGIAMAQTLAPDDLAKALTPAFDGIAKVLEQNGLVVAGMAKRLDHLEAQPAPGGPAVRAVDKSLPGGGSPAAADPDVATLDVLRKQLDQADDPAVQRYLSNQISQIEFKKVYR